MKKFLVIIFTIVTLIIPAYFCNAMSITSFSPIEGRTYTLVTITGVDFKNVSSILFGGVETRVKTINGTTITAEVPLRALTGKIAIRTSATDIFSTASFKVLPNVITFSPFSAQVGELVTISSESIIGGGAEVYFNGIKAPATVTEAMHEITVKVPTEATTGKITVKNEKFGNAVSDINFIVGSDIPATVNYLTYTIVSGDTLGEVATKFGKTVDYLKTLNNITDINKIEVGQVLKVGIANTSTAKTTTGSSSGNKSTAVKGELKFNGIVPVCNTGEIDTSTGNYVNDCDFNMVMSLINKVINFVLVTLATPLFALIIMYVGFLYLSAGGNPKNIEKSKTILKNALLGYVIALAAWLIVKSILLSLGFTDVTKYLG